jgi:hypothetical protein
MLCPDPLVGAFKRYGYSVVRLPSSEFCPLLLLESDSRHSAHAFGPVASNLPPLASQPLPTLHRDAPGPDLDIKATNEVSGKVAAGFLGPVLAALGADASASVSLSSARSVVITLRDVRRDWVSLGEIAEYLESGTGTGSAHVQAAAARGALFVVTAVLKSDQFSVGVDRSVAEELSTKAPGAGPVTVYADLKAAVSGSTTVSFKGGVSLSFAFQAIKLLYEDGQYVDFATARGLSGFALAAPDGLGRPVEGMLTLDDDLIDLT